MLLTLNEGRNIAACLESLRRQTNKDFEVILIDAASDDRTVEIAKGLRTAFPAPLRIEVAHTHIPIGQARNLGVLFSRAPHVAFVSADAELHERWVERALLDLETHDFTFSKQVHAPHLWNVGACVRGLRYHFPDEEPFDPLPFASNVAAAYRKEVLRQFPFDPNSNAAEDLLLARRAVRAGYRARYDPLLVVHHHDVANVRHELRKSLREGEGWARYRGELGPIGHLIPWGAILVLALAIALLAPAIGWPLFALALWAPALRRAQRRLGEMRPGPLLLGVLASPPFDIAFLLAYLGGLSGENPSRPPVAPAEESSAMKPAPPKPPGTKGRHTTVFIIMDAGRADYVHPDSMPFVHGLSQDALVGSFESPPGFAQRTVLFSGRYPDTSGNFSAFVFDPKASPFRWVRRLGPLRSLVRPRRILFPARIMIQKATQWATGAYHSDPAWIPPRFLPFFRPCEDMRPMFEPGALGATSLFDLCRAHGRTFRYLAHPVSGDDEDVHRTLVRELRDGKDNDVYVAQFSTPDQQGHKHGPHSDAMRKHFLRELDSKVASIHAALSAGYESWDLFLCGDHGMAPVAREVNVLGALKGLRSKAGKDYVVFVNSTLAVVWYLTDRGREEVELALAAVPGARFISDEERAQLRIPTDRRWGDQMLAADPGVLFWPDYFHVVDSKIVGMHGYLDKSEETHGMAILASSNGRVPKADVGLRSLVDVFPTLCELLGLPVPDSQEGASLLGAGPAREAPVVRAAAPAIKIASRARNGATKSVLVGE